jgi:polysaccharide export outer membrane protein
MSIKSRLVIEFTADGTFGPLRGVTVQLKYAFLLFLTCMALPVSGWSQDVSGYIVNAGDQLSISVWREEDLTGTVLVAPDGRCSFPLVGEVMAKGRTVSEIKEEITLRLSQYISDPVVTVSLQDISGNQIYVMGQVNRPGPYVMNPYLDVMQALSVAGGTTAFADLNSIIILRRTSAGQRAIRFRYNEVVRGQDLEQNIRLQSGDVVVVP